MLPIEESKLELELQSSENLFKYRKKEAFVVEGGMEFITTLSGTDISR